MTTFEKKRQLWVAFVKAVLDGDSRPVGRPRKPQESFPVTDDELEPRMER